MRNALAVLALLALAGCTPGTAEDFKWSVEVPKSVDKGAEFNLLVNTTRTLESATEGPTTKAVEGVQYHYQVHWTGGSSAPLRHTAYTGEPVKIRARLVAGPATILITSLNREGLDVKVLEAAVEVK